MPYTEELYHHGIRGQKWGVRRFQNADGTLTNLGRKRYVKTMGSERQQKRDTKDAKKILGSDAIYAQSNSAQQSRRIDKLNNKISKNQYLEKTNKVDKYKNKLSAAEEKRSQYEKLANHYQDELGKINDGTLKAGRDFFIGRTNYAVPIVTPVGIGVIGGQQKNYIKVNK